MLKASIRQLKSQLAFKPKAWVTILFVLFDLGLFASGLKLLQYHNLFAYLLSQTLLALCFLQNFILLHEAGHRACFSSKFLNNLIGHYTSIFCCMPFFPWTTIHYEHHKWTGNVDKDPVFALLKQAKKTNKLPFLLKLGWRTFLPFGVFFLHLVYWSYPIRLIIEKKMTQRVFLRCLFSVVFLATVYIIIFTMFPTIFKIKNFALALVFYGVIWELLSTPQHLGMPNFDKNPDYQQQALSTRTSRFPFLIERVLFLNFGYHTEHHIYPTLPWHELPKAQALLRPLLADSYSEVKGGIWNFGVRTSTTMPDFLGIGKEKESTPLTKA